MPPSGAARTVSSRSRLRMKKFFGFLSLLALILGAAWFSRPDRAPVAALAPLLPLAEGEGLDAIRPLPPPPSLPPDRVALGERLFSDPRLSADQSLACVSCHRFDLGGADGRVVSLGVGGAAGAVNAPTVFNSGLQFAQFWDGRARDLREQVAGPLHNPVEMASSWPQVIERLQADAEIRRDFARAYPDGLNAANIADAIASFEQSLVTVDAPFDRFLRGEREAIGELELEGYHRFRDFGCISCHQGVLLGGNMFQKFGVLGDYFAGRPLNPADLGRYNVTGRDEDRHVFKVPGLRNVALTAPYFHDGSAATLATAVTVMGRYQLGRDLQPDDVEAIVAFLGTLTGKLPEPRR